MKSIHDTGADQVPNSHIHSADTKENICRILAQEILDLATRCIAKNNRFSIVLTGGETIRDVYQNLAVTGCNWEGWQIYWGDERCVPHTHPDRNSREARALWLDRVAMANDQIHEIPAESGPEEGAKTYAATLKSIGVFDLVLLSLGEDGHVASLFPGVDWGTENESPAAIPVYDSLKPPTKRVSLSASRIAYANYIWILAVGASKREALNRCLDGQGLPVHFFKANAALTYFTDREAWNPGAHAN